MPHRHEDAKLILHLYELRREPRMREARDWFVRSFRAEDAWRSSRPSARRARTANASFRMVTGYWEMAASFVVHGVLHRELFFENNQELLFVWERVRELLPQLREANKNPAVPEERRAGRRLVHRVVERAGARAPTPPSPPAIGQISARAADPRRSHRLAAPQPLSGEIDP